MGVGKEIKLTGARGKVFSKRMGGIQDRKNLIWGR